MGLESLLRELYGRDVPEVWEVIRRRKGKGAKPKDGPILIAYPDAVEGWGLKDWEKLKALGFSAIHYLPTLFPFSNDRGFSIVDFRKIRPSLGSWPDISGFMVDLVLNHVSEWHDWFIRARAGDRKYREYFITFRKDEWEELDRQGAFSKVIRPRDTPLFKEYEFALPFDWDEVERFAREFEDEEFRKRYGDPVEVVRRARKDITEKWVVEEDRRYRIYDGVVEGLLRLLREMGKTEKRMVWTTFSTPYLIDQVDLNYRNPLVLAEMIDTALFYAQKGASYLRLDAITFAWKELFTECAHGKAELFPMIFKEALRQAGYSTKLVTESNVPFEENVKYLKRGSDMIYNFTLQGLLIYAIGRDPEPLFRHLPRIVGKGMFNFLSTHDGISLRGIEGLPEEEEIVEYLTGFGMVKYRKKGGERVPYEACSLPTDILGLEGTEFGLKVLLFLPGTPGIYYALAFGWEGGKYEKEERDLVRPVGRDPDLSMIKRVLELEETAREFRMSRPNFAFDGKRMEMRIPGKAAVIDFGKKKIKVEPI